jgi:hypothetical protein
MVLSLLTLLVYLDVKYLPLLLPLLDISATFLRNPQNCTSTLCNRVHCVQNTAYVGEERAYVGEERAYVGEERTYVGEERAYVGEERAYVAVLPCPILLYTDTIKYV